MHAQQLAHDLGAHQDALRDANMKRKEAEQEAARCREALRANGGDEARAEEWLLRN